MNRHSLRRAATVAIDTGDLIEAYQIHAFSRTVHGGNPAGVCILQARLDDDALRNIAQDLGPSVTAFVLESGNDTHSLRWFTRGGREVDSFCGHATISAAHVLLRLKDIEHNFGGNVARMVKGLSDSLTEDPAQKKSWQERKEAYIERLGEEPADVQLISAADKLYNAKAILDDFNEIGPAVFDRFKRGAKEQLWYFDELLKVFRAHPPNRIVNELDRVVQELKEVTANSA